MEQRQAAQEPIIIPPSEAAQYLAQRDIEVDLLKNGLQVGFTQRRNCSEFHPVTAPGITNGQKPTPKSDVISARAVDGP